jgi:dienelactone hydrolase
MLKRSFIIFCFGVVCNLTLNAQKRLVGIGEEKNWAKVLFIEVSNDGNYISYKIFNDPGSRIILQSTRSVWKVVIPDAEYCSITQNSQRALFKCSDSIGVMKLGRDSNIEYIRGVSEYSLIKYGFYNDLLAYKLKLHSDTLFIKDMESGREMSYPEVTRYWTIQGGNVFLIETVHSSNISELDTYDVSNGKSEKIWEGRKIMSLLTGNEGSEFVFTAAEKGDSSNTGIWIYRQGNKIAEKIIDNHFEGIGDGLSIGDIISFNCMDERLLFNLREFKKSPSENGQSVVDIWSYKDAKLQSEQLFELASGRKFINYKAVLNIKKRKIYRLESENEKVMSSFYTDKKMSFMLLESQGGGDISNEWNWNKESKVAVLLVSLNDGTKKVIDSGMPPLLGDKYTLSYNENYVYYYEPSPGNYWAYRIADGKRINMTIGVKCKWNIAELSDQPYPLLFSYQIAGVIKNSDAIMVYDQHGIYELDPIDKIHAVNLTKNREALRDLKIRLAPNYQTHVISANEKVPFSVSNEITKQEGVLVTSIDSVRNAFCCHLEPLRMCWTAPVKARDADFYIVSSMTAEQSPNLYCTADFKNYRKITDVHPEKAYNWMTAELINWKALNGSVDQGILYKPENFDPAKKYPLLIYYYERLSDRFHEFLSPRPSGGELNIPFFVSHGYLVFTPDIHYKIGWPGKSAYNDIVSGASYLAKRSYVDRRRIGLQGISFGGFETNYIITHTNLFAAAMSSSGMTDFISAYGSIVGGGMSRQRQYELSRDRIGATLWQRSDLYIENSPVLRADRVTTPLLMMANKNDDDVPVQQGIEFFTALRRLGKKAWMLQYDGQGHHVFGEASQDLTTRMFQFFNYYLKGESPPKWMTRGVPAALRRLDTGLELDTSGAKP